MDFEIEKLQAKVRMLENELERYVTWVPPGHFYSPIPSLDELGPNYFKIFNRDKNEIPGIYIKESTQIEFIEKLKPHFKQLPFKDNPQKGLRYYYRNDFFTYMDAIVLFSLIRELKPENIIEVGSGFSSAVILDTNEHFMNNKISCTFIEPYPDRLLSLVDHSDIRLIKSRLQDVPISEFACLKENDILFIDSSHVSKIGSDVNYLFFEILPMLNPNVYIHFHDIFYPFEYMESWVEEGRAWNEAYLLRAFLQYNTSFEVVIWNHFLQFHHMGILNSALPLFNKPGGGSLWLKKVK